MKGEENLEKWTYRVEALNGRLEIVNQYITTLDYLSDKLNNKII